MKSIMTFAFLTILGVASAQAEMNVEECIGACKTGHRPACYSECRANFPKDRFPKGDEVNDCQECCDDAFDACKAECAKWGEKK